MRARLPEKWEINRYQKNPGLDTVINIIRVIRGVSEDYHSQRQEHLSRRLQMLYINNRTVPIRFIKGPPMIIFQDENKMGYEQTP